MKIYVVRDLTEHEPSIAFITRADAEEYILTIAEYSLYKNFNKYLQYSASTVEWYMSSWKKDFYDTLYSYDKGNTLAGFMLWRESGAYIIEEMEVIK